MAPPCVTQDAIFTGANKHSHVLAYSPHCAAFGAGHAVALWDPLSSTHQGVRQTLHGHTREVTCVAFVPGAATLVSAAEDGRILVWRAAADGRYQRAPGEAQQAGSVTALATAAGGIVVSGGTLGDIVVWRLAADHSGLERQASFRVDERFLPSALCVQQLGAAYVLAVGGTLPHVFVYLFGGDARDVRPCAVLAGHEDAVRCLALAREPTGPDYLLASGSQDRSIRLWRLRVGAAAAAAAPDADRLVLLSNKQHRFTLGTDPAVLSSEALLMGHDDWVTGLQWQPAAAAAGPPALRLLSLGADTTLMVWHMDAPSGVWVPASRLGELSIKGASTATGALGGFWACVWLADPASRAQYILASGKTGAVRVYKNDAGDAGDAEAADTDSRWDAVLGVTGPVREVSDLVWSHDGSYVLATSLDQTTRLLAPWACGRPDATVTWHEFARPQIHGYDMVCVDNVSATRFVSGSDEKILRVFEMPQAIHALLGRFCGAPASPVAALPEAASLPVLGLSNKAANEQLEAGEAQQREEDLQNNAGAQPTDASDVLAALQGPPLEDHLQRHTLFPEIEKLYGHGYEITCCASSPSHSLVASACRANAAKHAVVRVFNAKNDFLLSSQVLLGHNLTIVSLEFSPDGRFLMAVSRDRQFSLWRVVDEATAAFELVELNAKAHSRIIWDCSWAPMGTPVFVSGSRDRTIKVWHVGASTVQMLAQTKTDHPVTSVACFQPELVRGKLLIGVGHETGHISLYALSPAVPDSLTKVLDFDAGILPGSRVNKLAFSNKTKGTCLQLAVGSVDTSIRIYSVDTASLLL
ncbi:WD40 repeat-like protein [Metschnikowia bicuspidata var. bicuspidata NRRL YB-4993]|uniref:Elongator complex protein 2 n=1 Tax=Metschnikowia bicuspidata var. bicuspidata NRRL YB-4993 TaxID=869754 RepID=A0A1A0HJ36_9ASCO|nr:WD40 repeat-like protein [Metschnikowia bicuspidata var. bicuspidata NRRL YB-4993]OBA24169.1 WD40 repeat-like protein [Metschnikowia bicuspidata var. bicuspidata NRRL YB-4993]